MNTANNFSITDVMIHVSSLDAALAFWGWPTPIESGPLLACRAALSIFREFAAANADPDSTLYGFQVGMGIGCGNAIAGKIGSEEQIKVGVFGPIVNLTARLESMTKQLGVTVLLDERSAEYAARHLPALFKESGLADINVEPRTMTYDFDLVGDSCYGTLERAVRAGIATVDEVSDWFADLERARDNGTFFCANMGYVVSGRKL